jgi:hypothetical protein
VAKKHIKTKQATVDRLQAIGSIRYP